MARGPNTLTGWLLVLGIQGSVLSVMLLLNGQSIGWLLFMGGLASLGWCGFRLVTNKGFRANPTMMERRAREIARNATPFWQQPSLWLGGAVLVGIPLYLGGRHGGPLLEPSMGFWYYAGLVLIAVALVMAGVFSLLLLRRVSEARNGALHQRDAVDPPEWLDEAMARHNRPTPTSSWDSLPRGGRLSFALLLAVAMAPIYVALFWVVFAQRTSASNPLGWFALGLGWAGLVVSLGAWLFRSRFGKAWRGLAVVGAIFLLIAAEQALAADGLLTSPALQIGIVLGTFFLLAGGMALANSWSNQATTPHLASATMNPAPTGDTARPDPTDPMNVILAPDPFHPKRQKILSAAFVGLLAVVYVSVQLAPMLNADSGGRPPYVFPTHNETLQPRGSGSLDGTWMVSTPPLPSQIQYSDPFTVQAGATQLNLTLTAQTNDPLGELVEMDVQAQRDGAWTDLRSFQMSTTAPETVQLTVSGHVTQFRIAASDNGTGVGGTYHAVWEASERVVT